MSKIKKLTILLGVLAFLTSCKKNGTDFPVIKSQESDSLIYDSIVETNVRDTIILKDSLELSKKQALFSVKNKNEK